MSRVAFPLPVVLFVLVGIAASSLRAADWLQWRGPARDGSVRGVVLPDRLQGEALKQAWRVDLAPGYSGPIVAGNKVFTTETESRATEIVRALDVSTGKEVWRASWSGAMTVPFFAKANGDWIRATPACDGERLYVAGMCDVLVCLDVNTGKELWRYDFVKELKTPLPAFGFASSPLLEGDAVIVQAGAGTCKLDKISGKLLWRSLTDEGGMSGSAFGSPVIATLGGKQQLLVQSRTHLAGLSLDKGKELWSQPVEAFRGMNILTPTVHEGDVFTSTYGGETAMFQIAADKGTLSASKKWALKLQGYMTSPVIVDGMAIELTRDQRLVAVDLSNGAKLWEIKDKFGKYWSMVTDGKKVLALDQKGELLLFQPSRTDWNLIDRIKVTEAESWAHLAITNGQIWVRDLSGLTAWKFGQP
ncbi:MAG: PQQ-binding-like beta-propeller repeat protein [Verrucomicrobiaceae bacterium]|nr:PQQ-binding-like beta-propeller repeat protein [Verrucomicrobiaceae bacterium]